METLEQLQQDLPEWARGVIPEGKDALDNLTVGELAAIGRKLGVSVERAVKHDVEGKKWTAYALVGHAWEKRRELRGGPKAGGLDRWHELEGPEFYLALFPDQFLAAARETDQERVDELLAKVDAGELLTDDELRELEQLQQQLADVDNEDQEADPTGRASW